MVRPPSSHPAVCSIKCTPASIEVCSVLADSYAAWASGIFEAHRPPPLRNGTPRRRASAAAIYMTCEGSGVPNVGAPDCIEIELLKVPNMTGAPGLTSCTKAMPASASAKIWVQVPMTVTGDIAPARINGEITVACPFLAYTRAAPSMVASKVIGELALIRLVMTQCSFTNASPNTNLAMSTVSCALSGAVTEPIKGLSLQRR